MRRASQLAVMESGKFASSMTSTSDSSLTPSIMALLTSSFLRVSPRPSALPVESMCQVGVLLCEEKGRTAAETEDLDMVASLRPGECQDGRRKEHGFIIWVGDEQADALVSQDGEARAHNADGGRVENGRQHQGSH